MIEARIDVSLRGLDLLIAAAGPRANTGIARALNRAGTPTANAEIREVKKILGLRNHPRVKTSLGDAVKRKTSKRKATSSRLEYSLSGWGYGFPLIYYQPKETPQGATVNWLGARKRVARSFYLSGKFPRRRASSISHAVWQRVGKGRWSLKRSKGPGVPAAMVQPSSKAIWQTAAAQRLPAALAKELGAILAGHA